MMEEAEIVMPTEILNNIFLFLPAIHLMKCRRVSSRWRSIVDRLASKEDRWMNFCKTDFKEYYAIAKRKASPDITWYNLYKSMFLWPKLAYAEEKRDEFAPASTVLEEIRSVEVLGNEVAVVHRKNGITYYNTNTLEITSRKAMRGDYARYNENQYVIVIQNYLMHLYVIQKMCNNVSDDITTLNNVKIFLLTDNYLYYVKLNNEIHVCNINSSNQMTHTLLKGAEMLDGVISLGYKNNCLNVLTYERNIYSIVNNKDVVLKETITYGTNILNVLHQYNVLDQLDWHVFFQWIHVFGSTIPEGPLRNTIIIKSYGDLFFVGTDYGVLAIFHHPFINGEFDFFNSQPLTQLNFMERRDIPVLATCPIMQIDVMETDNGHTVFVAMPKKIAVIKYTYNVHPVLWAVPTYSHEQDAQYRNLNVTDMTLFDMF